MQLVTEKTADAPAAQRSVVQQLGPLRTIILVGAALEVAVPLVTMWLSDVLLFDIPRWTLWWLFGAPPAITLFAALGWHIMKGRARHTASRVRATRAREAPRWNIPAPVTRSTRNPS